jgi:hypothetical protein
LEQYEAARSDDKESSMLKYLLPVACLLVNTHPRAFAQHNMPAGLSHDRHVAQLKEAALKERGRRAMGFDQDRTTHHFILRPDGGIISVEVNDPTDDTNRNAIRTHLERITADFATGRFDAPLLTHGEEPPGTSAMRALRRSIRYVVERTAGGARVRMSSTNDAAIAAIHDFLAYQIREHQTGDPVR